MQASSRLEVVRKMLRRRGAPGAYVARLVRELGEHREDMVQNLLREGMTPEQAEIEADRRMGDPAELAEATFEKMRRASVVGRHRVFWLMVLPVVLLPVTWIATLSIAAWWTGMFDSNFKGYVDVSQVIRLGYACTACDRLMPALIGSGFYLLARRRFCGRMWAWMPTLLLSLISSLLYARLYPGPGGAPHGRLIVGIAPTIDLLNLFGPIGVVLLAELSQIFNWDFGLWERKPRQPA